MNISTVLQRLGYSEVAVKVFEVLLKENEASVTRIAARCGLYRPSVYRGIQQLMRGELVVSHTRGRRRVYSAVDKQTVLQRWRQLDTNLARKMTKPVLRAQSFMTVTTGESAIRDAFDHVAHTLQRGDTFYRVTSEKNLDEVNALLSPNYRKKRDAKRLERLVISNKSSGARKQNRLERFIRYIDETKAPFDHNVILLIYGTFVTYIDLSKLEVLQIENEHLASFERSRFEALYFLLRR